MRSSLTCLIVDDVQNIRVVTKQVLMKMGCKSVLEASTGEEALKLLSNDKKHKPVDLIFLDLGLPQMSGLDCLRAIRSNPKTSQIRCVILTSERVEDHVREAIALGAAGYVVKPFSPRTLETHLDRALADRDKVMEKSS